uniref:Uncharacterized protein n=1 Tax=Colletotrichum fructicola (strain Nara gc5) TaxID=1213859 RepID=L2FLC1_COLFN
MSSIPKSDEALFAEAAAEWQAEHDAGLESLCSMGDALIAEVEAHEKQKRAATKPNPCATCPVLKCIDFANMNTADILKAYIVTGIVPVHPQTVSDFGFDRTVTQADGYQLLDVYRHLMVTTLSVTSGEDKLRAALEAGGGSREEMNQLKDTFSWLTRNRYIWDTTYANSETRAYMDAAGAKPINTKADFLEQVKLMSDGLVHHLTGPGGMPFAPIMYMPGANLAGFAEEIKAQQVAAKVARKKAAMEQEK